MKSRGGARPTMWSCYADFKSVCFEPVLYEAIFVQHAITYVIRMGTIPIPSIEWYCLYLRVEGKYRYFHQVSLVFDTEPALFMVSMYVWKPQENVNQSEEKAEKCKFFLKVCLIELDQGRILHSCLKPFWQRYCVTIKLC